MRINFVSVIVPTYKSWDTLKLCVQALSKQLYPAEKFELIIVNNNTEDTPPKDLLIPSNCRVISHGVPGSYAARNRGAEVAKGDLYLFTDADCIPDSNWISNYIDCYKEKCLEPNRTILAGGVTLYGKEEYLNFSECYDYLVGLNQHLYVKRGGAVTANMAVPKVLFEKLNGFDEVHFSGGDTDFCKRAGRIGVELVYVEAAFVKHPLRNSLSELIKKDKRLIAAKYHRSKFETIMRAISPPVVRARLIVTNRSGVGFKTRGKAFAVLLFLWFNRLLEVAKLSTNPSYTKMR